MIPAIDHIKISQDGSAAIVGSVCDSCGSVFVGERDHCAKCHARHSMKSHELSRSGKIHTYSIVHRSFPGIETPFVSAIIALDGGGSVQATVKDISIEDPDALFGQPVELVFAPTNQKTKEGETYLAYHFKPV